jgi:signal transduction histidine kinase
MVVAQVNEDAARRICRNLLENAIKFTPEGGRVEVRVSAEGSHPVLEVEDSGIGMDPDKVPELFEAFKQESEGPDREYEGSGIGLSIVKRLTEEMNGRVGVDTEKGEGTCVTVRLPRP